jgi:hypothetical protein
LTTAGAAAFTAWLKLNFSGTFFCELNKEMETPLPCLRSGTSSSIIAEIMIPIKMDLKINEKDLSTTPTNLTNKYR